MDENVPYNPYKALLKAIFEPPVTTSPTWPEIGSTEYTQQMLEQREIPEILILKKWAPWIVECQENKEILFCIIPYRLKEGEYELNPIPESDKMPSFDLQRVRFPSEWKKHWGKNLEGMTYFSPYGIRFDSIEHAKAAAKQAVEIYKNSKLMPSVDGEAVDLLFSNTAIVNRIDDEQ